QYQVADFIIIVRQYEAQFRSFGCTDYGDLFTAKLCMFQKVTEKFQRYLSKFFILIRCTEEEQGVHFIAFLCKLQSHIKITAALGTPERSEERRVGTECRHRWQRREQSRRTDSNEG